MKYDELLALMDEFLLQYDNIGKDEWYVTDRRLRQIGVIEFVQWLESEKKL